MPPAPTILVVACVERGADNDPESFELAFHQGPAFIYEYNQDATNLIDQD